MANSIFNYFARKEFENFATKVFVALGSTHSVLGPLVSLSIVTLVAIGVVTFISVALQLLLYCIKKCWVNLTTYHLPFWSESLFNILLNLFGSKIQADYRSIIRTVVYRPLSIDKQHSHPLAATNRTRANRWIDEACALIGRIPFSLSGSNRDYANGNDVRRLNYFIKDLSIPTSFKTPTKQHALKLIDVDYYVDMPKLLKQFVPTFLYTFVPMKVAGSLPDGTFYIENDEIVTTINGGSNYRHLAWDYQSDVLCVDYWWGTNVYLVEQLLQEPSTQRRTIFLNPIRKIYGPFAWFLPGKRLARTTYTFQDVNIIRSQKQENGNTETTVSMSLNGSTCCLTISEKILRACLIRCGLSKDPSISDVERIFRQHQLEEPDISAALFMEIYKKNTKMFKLFEPILTVPTDSYLDKHTYQATFPLVMEDGKAMARQILPAYYASGFAPARSHNNDHACIAGRIDRLRNPNNPPPPFYLRCRQEFLEFLIPRHLVHSFAPLTEAEVEKLQNRPTQRALAERAKPFSHYLQFIIKSFQKAEVYGKLHYPRNISTVPTDHKLRYSAFVYPIAKRLKDFSWYAFGLNPREITERVRDVCSAVDTIIPTDYECFDGTHGEFKYEFDMMLFSRAYHPDYHGEVLQLKSVMRNAHAITTTGVKYNTGTTVISGGADTSTGNTNINALLSYIALRLSNYGPQEAWQRLGLYGGDDGLNGHVSAANITKVATKLGYVLKAQTLKAGQPVPFLGRVFLDPWTTSASICDVPRRLRGLHLTTTPRFVPDELVLLRKAESYSINDPATPIIREWCGMIRRLCKKNHSGNFEQFLRVEDSYYKDIDNNWTPPQGIEIDYAYQLVASELGVSYDYLHRFTTLLNNATDLKVKFTFPHEPTAKIPCVVGGVFYEP